MIPEEELDEISAGLRAEDEVAEEAHRRRAEEEAELEMADDEPAPLEPVGDLVGPRSGGGRRYGRPVPLDEEEAPPDEEEDGQAEGAAAQRGESPEAPDISAERDAFAAELIDVLHLDEAQTRRLRRWVHERAGLVRGWVRE